MHPLLIAAVYLIYRGYIKGSLYIFLKAEICNLARDGTAACLIGSPILHEDFELACTGSAHERKGLGWLRWSFHSPLNKLRFFCSSMRLSRLVATCNCVNQTFASIPKSLPVIIILTLPDTVEVRNEVRFLHSRNWQLCCDPPLMRLAFIGMRVENLHMRPPLVSCMPCNC